MVKLSTISFPSKASEKNWLNSVMVLWQTDSEIEIKPCVFRLSEELKDTKAEAYTPQKMGLGPFHHCQQAGYKIAHKISIVKQYLKTNDLQQILDFFKGHSKSFEPAIRLFYAAELDIDTETLLLIVIIDAIYLLHLINTYLGQEKGKHEFHDHVSVRDAMMLENQIPLILIRGVLRNLKLLDPELELTTEDDLFDKYYSFCGKLLPVELADTKASLKKEFSKTYHLLHFMHQLFVSAKMASLDVPPGTTATLLDVPPGALAISLPDPGKSMRDACVECKGLAVEIFRQINDLVDQAKAVHGKIQSCFDSTEQVRKLFARKMEARSNEEYFVPEACQYSVSIEDHTEGFLLLEACQDSGSTEHDPKREIIHVPIMTLDQNTEVILRNLLAYEAAIKKAEGHEVEDGIGVSEKVKSHMSLMCAITKTEEDVTWLKERNIIKTEMNNKDVVEIFEGLKQCMEKQPLESTFLDTNEDSDVSPTVKAFFEKINKWVVAFFKFLKIVLPILVVLLFFFQYFCNIYNCHRQPLFGTPLGLDLQAEIMPPRKVLRNSS